MSNPSCFPPTPFANVSVASFRAESPLTASLYFQHKTRRLSLAPPSPRKGINATA